MVSCETSHFLLLFETKSIKTYTCARDTFCSMKPLRWRQFTIKFAIVCKQLPVAFLLPFASDKCSLGHECFLYVLKEALLVRW